MKKFFIVVAAIFVLAACASPIDDLIDNQFTSIKTSDAKSNYVGIWTGTSGPYLVTMKINSDGRGLMCSSWTGKDQVSNLKINGNIIYFQDGAKLQISEESGKLTGRYDSIGAKDVHFVRDEQLIEASPYCKKQINY